LFFERNDIGNRNAKAYTPIILQGSSTKPTNHRLGCNTASNGSAISRHTINADTNDNIRINRSNWLNFETLFDIEVEDTPFDTSVLWYCSYNYVI
jgi:hypothetical protein